MEVKLKRCLPGHRYRTQKDVLIEVSVAKEKDLYGRSQPRTEAATGRILVHLVDEKTGKANYADTTPIMQSYVMHDNLPEAESKIKHGMTPGKPRQPDKSFRGWALRCKHRMRTILTLSIQRGCYVKDTSNYYTIGMNGQTFFKFYKNGVLKFHTLPKGLKEHYEISTAKWVTKYGHGRYALNLRGVPVVQWSVFIERLNFWLSEATAKARTLSVKDIE